MSTTARKVRQQPEPDPVDVNISRVVETLLAHQRRKPIELASALPNIGKTTIYARLKNDGAGWEAAEVARLAAFFDKPVSLFYEDAEELVRSRCFAPLTLVDALPGQVQLDFSVPPRLTLVRS